MIFGLSFDGLTNRRSQTPHKPSSTKVFRTIHAAPLRTDSVPPR